jgi:hypothetical protein
MSKARRKALLQQPIPTPVRAEQQEELDGMLPSEAQRHVAPDPVDWTALLRVAGVNPVRRSGSYEVVGMEFGTDEDIVTF